MPLQKLNITAVAQPWNLGLVDVNAGMVSNVYVWYDGDVDAAGKRVLADYSMGDTSTGHNAKNFVIPAGTAPGTQIETNLLGQPFTFLPNARVLYIATVVYNTANDKNLAFFKQWKELNGFPAADIGVRGDYDIPAPVPGQMDWLENYILLQGLVPV